LKVEIPIETAFALRTGRERERDFPVDIEKGIEKGRNLAIETQI
jgi:hypothetical protein